MDKELIELIVNITGVEEDKVQEFLDTLSLDQTYELIDSKVRKDEEKIKELVSSLKDKPDNDLEEAKMRKDKNKDSITLKVPKPRDPMARELAKGQYQPKSTPNRKERQEKRENKHKGKSHFESQEVMESVMGVSGMPVIKKMLTLAGRPHEDEDVQAAMEDYMSAITAMDNSMASGSEMSTGFDDVLDFEDDDTDLDFPDAEESQDPYVDICHAFANIKANLPNITVAEYIQVRKLMAELASALDLLRNDQGL